MQSASNQNPQLCALLNPGRLKSQFLNGFFWDSVTLLILCYRTAEEQAAFCDPTCVGYGLGQTPVNYTQTWKLNKSSGEVSMTTASTSSPPYQTFLRGKKVLHPKYAHFCSAHC